jgi:DNA-binding transcriptional MerR regulator
VTISKIRFLESQGLVDPERTPSGYRKFYETDLDRLRWVLRQQRDAFLPLKVIKGRLEGQGELALDEADNDADGGPTMGPLPAGGQNAGDRRAGATYGGLLEGPHQAEPHQPGGHEAGQHRPGGREAGGLEAGGHQPGPHQVGSHEAGPQYGDEVAAEVAGGQAAPGPSPSSPVPVAPGNGGGDIPTAQMSEGPRPPVAADRGPEDTGGEGDRADGGGGEGACGDQLFDAGPPPPVHGVAGPPGPPGRHGAMTDGAIADEPDGVEIGGKPTADMRVAAAAKTVDPGRRGEAGKARTGRREPSLAVGSAPDEEDLALEELMSEAGVEVVTVRDLERFGLITPRVVGGTAYYTHEAAVIAQLASAFARHGVEARHLRAYKGAAEREAGMVQQVIMPLIRQRNPEARQAAARAVDELSQLGGELRAALLRSALADMR